MVGIQVVGDLRQVPFREKRKVLRPVTLPHAMAAVHCADVARHKQGAVRIAVDQARHGGGGFLGQGVGVAATLAVNLGVKGNALPEYRVAKGGGRSQGKVIGRHKKWIGGGRTTAPVEELPAYAKIRPNRFQGRGGIRQLPAPVPPLAPRGRFQIPEFHQKNNCLGKKRKNRRRIDSTAVEKKWRS